MNAKLKSLIWVFIQLSVLTGIGLIWLRAIKEQRVQRSESLAVKIYCSDPEQTLIEVADVYQWLNGFYKKDVRKIPVYQLNLKQLESFLMSQPLVEHADLYVDRKNRLHLDVHQRIPLVRVIDRDGGQYYLDGSGYRIPVSTKYAARVPVATGHLIPVSGKKLGNKEALYYAGLLEVASAIRKDTFMHALIEQIDLD
ncbi:MAG TPA: hypothetical protein VFX48_02990, partial [Saprospiraceae bacterium]|nr:hypothetical protein [Saprospiraceae bacterium]